MENCQNLRIIIFFVKINALNEENKKKYSNEYLKGIISFLIIYALSIFINFIYHI